MDENVHMPESAFRAALAKLRRPRVWAVVLVVAAHAGALLLMLHAQSYPMREFEPSAVAVNLVRPPAPPPTPPPPRTPPKPAESKAPAPASSPRPAAPTPPTPVPAPPALQVHAVTEAPSELTEAQLSGAVTAGSGEGEGNGPGDGRGGSGRGCNMIRRLQAALRRDARIQAAAAAHRGSGAAILVWNGDWIRSTDESGKGLAGVRQAITVEVAFSPEACRAQPMHGLVLISLADAPGSPRLALGSGAWRWSDLLSAHR